MQRMGVVKTVLYVLCELVDRVVELLLIPVDPVRRPPVNAHFFQADLELKPIALYPISILVPFVFTYRNAPLDQQMV